MLREVTQNTELNNIEYRHSQLNLGVTYLHQSRKQQMEINGTFCCFPAPISMQPWLISTTGSYRERFQSCGLQFSFRLYISLAQKNLLF